MLQQMAAALTLPGLPDWTGLILLLLLALVVLAYLLMPFSVFGVKGRLEAIETQLDEIQTEIRSLALRLPEPGRRSRPAEADWDEPPARAPLDPPVPSRTPPVPPPATYPEEGRPAPDRRAGRAEPRLDWPRTR